jgi:L-seryl-tRNA(Ser) seleniumtransferase
LSRTADVRHDAAVTDDARRGLPSIDRLLGTADGAALLRLHRRDMVVDVLRAVLAEARAAGGGGAMPAAERVMGEAARRLGDAAAPRLLPVLNMTGVCLHTNLGRATLPDAALVALLTAAIGPTNLELDLDTGRRGDRNALVADDLRALTGAEDALVVNNNAAGVLLALNSLAAGRDVIVSRGELVEIGGSFRIPDVMAKSGARLREVGTTNRTHADDYRRAAGPATAALLRVHTSNYRVVGFTAAPTLAELVDVARAAGVPLIEDLGSGALVDLAPYGIPDEPVVRAHVAAGVDLCSPAATSCSGPAGGHRRAAARARRPLCGRIRSSAPLRPEQARRSPRSAHAALLRSAPDLRGALPVLGWLARPLADARARRRAPRPRLCGAGSGRTTSSRSCVSARWAVARRRRVELPSRALAVSHPRSAPSRSRRASGARRRRSCGRVHDGALLLDLRGIATATSSPSTGRRLRPAVPSVIGTPATSTTGRRRSCRALTGQDTDRSQGGEGARHLHRPRVRASRPPGARARRRRRRSRPRALHPQHARGRPRRRRRSALVAAGRRWSCRRPRSIWTSSTCSA